MLENKASYFCKIFEKMVQSEEVQQDIRYYNLWATTVLVMMDEVKVGDMCLRNDVHDDYFRGCRVNVINQSGTLTVIDDCFMEVTNVKASELRI